jgi:catechol 2,3-dioxygenase-like lactoylglutathione lyase family enzyme
MAEGHRRRLASNFDCAFAGLGISSLPPEQKDRKSLRPPARPGSENMPLARPIKFAHVVYRTRRFEEMLEWYRTVFGAKVQFENPALAFLTYDDEHHRFAIANMSVLHPDGAETEKRDAIGVDHVGYTYASVGDLLENYAALKEAGIAPYWSIHHGITVSMYYADPDGNQMEFQVDAMPTSADAGNFMAESFAANPIGVEFDPEEWLSKYRAGTPLADFLERKAHEPVSPIRGAFARLLAN